MPFKPSPKLERDENHLLTKLLDYIGQGEIRRNQVYYDYKDIFGDKVVRKTALDVFDEAKRKGHLAKSKEFNQAEYFKVVRTKFTGFGEESPTPELTPEELSS